MYKITNEQIPRWISLTPYNEKLPQTLVVTCPHCSNHHVPFVVTWHLARTGDNSTHVQSHIAGYSDCGVCGKQIFILHVATQDAKGMRVSSGNYILPEPPIGKGFTGRLADASPGFVKIYQQAAKAEAAGLDEIAGPGYRKALEFLVKDYLLLEAKNEDKDKIKRTMLGPCISDHIKDDEIKVAADAAKVVGNSETHYVKDETATLEDLKEFIDLTVYWVEKKLATADLVKKAKVREEEKEKKKAAKASN